MNSVHVDSVNSVVVRGVRAAAALDPGDEALVALMERDGEPKPAEANLPVRAVLERFAVLRWVAPRRVDDFVQLIEDSALLVGRE